MTDVPDVPQPNWRFQFCYCPLVLLSVIWLYLPLKAQEPFLHLAQSRRDGPGKAPVPFLQPTPLGQRGAHDVPGKAQEPFLQPVPLSQGDGQDASCLLSVSPAGSRVSPGTEEVQVSNRTISIFVNGVYGWPGAGLVPSCPVPCQITTDSKEILANWRTADIVIWNMQALVCGINEMGAKWETKPLGQKWVANYDFEALPRAPPEFISPIGPGIDWTASFQKDSVFLKHLSRFLPAERQDGWDHSWNEGKDRLLLWLVSKCGTTERNLIFQELESYLPSDRVHKYGGCSELKDPCQGDLKLNETCLEKFTKRYKFYAAFENTRCEDYITEKFWKSLRLGMVPVCWGGRSRKDYERIAPGSSFIHVDDFASIKELAQYLLKVDKDPELYNSYFEWRKTSWVNTAEEESNRSACELCMEMLKPKTQQQPSVGPHWSKRFFAC